MSNLNRYKKSLENVTHSESVDNFNEESMLNKTRRILRGNEVEDTRPYMVYLRAAFNSSTKSNSSNWLCGGVIVHSQHILTSAACVEDVKQFHVVSGTHRWVPLGEEDECVKNGAKRAIWKCVTKDYVFDGREFDNIRWMINDIAVVKVHEPFDFGRRIRGCDFIPKPIGYNNQSASLEDPGTAASIAGWGSVDRFGDTYERSTMNSPELLETDVIIISKKHCRKQWPERYHYVIDKNMVCTRDSIDVGAIADLCKEHEISCKELVYSDEDDKEDHYRSRRFMLSPNNSQIHSSGHLNDTRRTKTKSGGFCENDHGGPLVVGHGKRAVVIGIISACMTANVTQKCFGPFLYTSVWHNRHIIGCAIEKDYGASCQSLLRSFQTRMVETKYDWPSLREGPKVSINKSKQTTSISKHPKFKFN